MGLDSCRGGRQCYQAQCRTPIRGPFVSSATIRCGKEEGGERDEKSKDGGTLKLIEFVLMLVIEVF